MPGSLFTFRRLGTVGWLIAALATLTAVGARAAGGGIGGVSSSPRCPATGLVVWLDTEGNGAAGSIYYRLELTNLSGRTCTVYGYPGVSAVDLRGRRLGSAASRDPVHKPRLVSLAEGTTATVVLRIVQAANFPASSCRPVTAAGLRVYPPDETAAKVVPFPFRACSRRGPVYLTVQAARRA
jgi:hypothetical protein